MKIYLFYCSTNIDSDELTRACSKYGNDFHFVPLPCSGKIDIRYLTKAFETGADGVVVVTCKKGECRYLEGNLRARKRVEAIEELLEEIGVEKGRSVLFEITDNGIKGVINELDEFRLKIGTLPNLTPVSGSTVSKR